MHEDALKLHELWRKDLARDALLDESRALKAHIADRNAALSEAQAGRTQAKESLEGLKERERAVNRKTATYEKRKMQAQRSIDQGLATDYDAALGQVTQCSAILDDLETEQLELMDAFEGAEQQLERATQVEALIESQALAAQRAYDDRYPSLKREFDAATVARDEARPQVWRELLPRYDALRKHKRPAFANIRDSTCLGCNVQISGTEMSSFRRDLEVSFCKHCGRVLNEVVE